MLYHTYYKGGEESHLTYYYYFVVIFFCYWRTSNVNSVLRMQFCDYFVSLFIARHAYRDV